METKEFCQASGDLTNRAPQTGETPANPIRLWLVDDNHELRQTLAELLATKKGIECTGSFGSANAALSALASHAGPDVILLDINMGNENGLDAVRPILSLSRSTQVFMLTTFFDPNAKTRALSDGAAGFLLKQYSVDRILESIRQARSNPTPPARRQRRSHTEAIGWTSSAITREPRLVRPQKSWLERISNILSWN